MKDDISDKTIIPNITNILQVDVEDWYCSLDFDNWTGREDRIVRSTTLLLNILKDTDTKATFFILGYTAERHPELIQMIKHDGHEIGTHGYRHLHLGHQSASGFSEDLNYSLRILRQIAGDHIIGHRAPLFSMTESTAWAVDILKTEGLRYDSSVFPAKTPLYGFPKAPRFAYRISSDMPAIDNPDETFWEIPLSVLRIPFLKMNLPIAGGFYLRLFPYSVIRYAISRLNRVWKQPAVCYLHSWEIDIGQPRIDQLPWFHYYNLNTTEKKLRQLLRDFIWGTTRDVFGFSE